MDNRGSPPATPARPVIVDADVSPEDVARTVTIGELLRVERERQGIGLDQVEAATRIRAAQLRALEEDRLDSLPAEAYARAFVRDYAEHLGLDADRAVHRFNEQWNRTHVAEPEHSSPYDPPIAASPDLARRLGSLGVVLAVLALVLSAGVFIVRAEQGPSRATAPPSSPPSAPSTSAPSGPSTTPAAQTGAAPPPKASHPHVARLRLLASPGDCWFEARVGSSTGQVIAERTLASGESVWLHGRRIWLRLGDQASARLLLNGHPVSLAAVAGPGNVLVTPSGVTPV
jgi:cytoskeleton protein RodZ